MERKIIPQGRYVVRATQSGLDRTASGREYIWVGLEIMEGDFQGESLTWKGWLNDEKSIETAVRSLTLMGWEKDSDALDDVSGLGSTPCQAVVVHKEGDNGNIYVNVKYINKLGGMGSRINPDETKIIAEKLRPIVRAVKDSILEDVTPF